MSNENTSATPAAVESKPVGTEAKKAAKKPSKPVVTKPAAKSVKGKAKSKAKSVKGKAKPKSKPAATGERLVPANLDAYVKDTEHKTAGGHASIHCGDAVAKKLLGKDIDECYKIAAKAINEPEKTLRAKYGHLNAGMQRMSLGNRMRGAAA